jgi:hypothetical protein
MTDETAKKVQTTYLILNTLDYFIQICEIIHK